MAQDRNVWIEELYHKEFGRLYHVAYRLSNSSKEAAMDLVQDTFMLALSHWKELQLHACPTAWLIKTLSNLAKNRARRFFSNEISLETLFGIPAPEITGVEALLPGKLPEGDRQLLIWRFEQKLDYKEIAQRLRISENTCRSRVARTLERCRDLLDISDFSP